MVVSPPNTCVWNPSSNAKISWRSSFGELTRFLWAIRVRSSWWDHKISQRTHLITLSLHLHLYFFLSLSLSLLREDTARRQPYASQIEGSPRVKHTKSSDLGLPTSKTIRYKCLFFKTKYSVIFCCGSWSWLQDTEFPVSGIRSTWKRQGRQTDRRGGIYFSRGDIWNLIFENFCWLHQPMQFLLNIIKLILKWLSSSHQAKMLIQTKKKRQIWTSFLDWKTFF